jgi:hypothetical protein
MNGAPKQRRRAYASGADVVLVAALAAGCVRPAPQVPSADAAQPAPDPVHLSLERGPCFGTCPVYKVTLEGSGAVLFEGRRFVADSGVSTSSVPAERIDSLVAAITAAGFFGFADRYAAGEPDCERYATDLPSAIIEVRAGGREKRVEHDHGCMGAPPALSTLEALIDTVAGVSQWLRR